MPPEPTDPNAAPETPAEGEAEAPKYLTAADFNKAATAREKRQMAAIEKVLSDRLAALTAKPEKGDEDEDDDAPATPEKGAPAGATPAADPQTARELAKLKRQLEREKAEREKERGEREAQAAKIARDEERTKLGEALAGVGIDAKRGRAAVALLHTEDKRVRRNAEGAIVFVTDEGDEEELAKGIKAWAATDEGKTFLPVRDVSGSGATGGSPGPTRGTKRGADPKADARRALGKLLMGG